MGVASASDMVFAVVAGGGCVGAGERPTSPRLPFELRAARRGVPRAAGIGGIYGEGTGEDSSRTALPL